MPHATSSVGLAVGLCGAFLAAFVAVFIRQMSATEASEAIVFYFMLTCSTISGASMLFAFTPPSTRELGLLVATGLFGGIGQVAMTYSYRYAEPSVLAPFDYVAIVWASALGYLVFGEVPAPIVFVGTSIVMSAGLLIAWRERERGPMARFERGHE